MNINLYSKNLPPLVFLASECLAKHSGNASGYVCSKENCNHQQWYVQREQPIKLICEERKLNKIGFKA